MPADNFKSEKPVLQLALKRFIIKERLRKKEEEAQHSALEQERKEREKKKKLDTMTLEQTKDKISAHAIQLDKLREDKHQLFSELKKVLHREEQKKSQQTPPAATAAASVVTNTVPTAALPASQGQIAVVPVQSPPLSQDQPSPTSLASKPPGMVLAASKPELVPPPIPGTKLATHEVPTSRPNLNSQLTLPATVRPQNKSVAPSTQSYSIAGLKRHRSASPAQMPSHRPPTYAVAHHPLPPPPLGAIGVCPQPGHPLNPSLIGLHHGGTAVVGNGYPVQPSPFHGNLGLGPGVGAPPGMSPYHQRSPNPYIIPSLVSKPDQHPKLGPGSLLHTGYGTLHSAEPGNIGLRGSIPPSLGKPMMRPPHLVNLDVQHRGRQSMGLISSGYAASKKAKLGVPHQKMYSSHRGYLGGNPHYYP